MEARGGRGHRRDRAAAVAGSPRGHGRWAPGIAAVTAYLTPEWLEGWSAAVADAGVVYDGPPASVEVRVDGGPDGPLAWRVQLEPGAPPRYEAAGGPAGASQPPEPDVYYEQAWADAVAQLEGRFDPCVAFMQGNLKARG